MIDAEFSGVLHGTINASVAAGAVRSSDGAEASPPEQALESPQPPEGETEAGEEGEGHD